MSVDGKVKVEEGESGDAKYAMQAESFVRNALVYEWHRFNRIVNSVTDKTQCKRAAEKPRRLEDGSFDTRIPQSECLRKQCNNGNFFRSQLPKIKELVAALEKTRKAEQSKGADSRWTAELEKALTGLKSGIANPDGLYDYQKCLAVGDVWIHLESMVAGVKDFGTRNYKESQFLCPPLNLNLKEPGKNEGREAAASTPAGPSLS